MIEINLLPGAKKKRGGKGASFQMPDLKALAGVVKDPWLIALVVGWVLVAAVVLFFYLPRKNAVAALVPELAAVEAEAKRLAEVRITQAQAESSRVELTSQIDLIRNIDRERYIWPHIMDEVSRALPPYTWLDDITAQAGVEDSGGVHTIPVQLTGKSGDVQAITRFVRNLEESPFLANVSQGPTSSATENGRDVYNFTITLRYAQPDSTHITTQPLAATLVQGYRSGQSRPRGR